VREKAATEFTKAEVVITSVLPVNSPNDRISSTLFVVKELRHIPQRIVPPPIHCKVLSDRNLVRIATIGAAI